MIFTSTSSGRCRNEVVIENRSLVRIGQAEDYLVARLDIHLGPSSLFTIGILAFSPEFAHPSRRHWLGWEAVHFVTGDVLLRCILRSGALNQPPPAETMIRQGLGPARMASSDCLKDCPVYNSDTGIFSALSQASHQGPISVFSSQFRPFSTSLLFRAEQGRM